MKSGDGARAIRYVWFDQDNTLYDYHGAMTRALNACLSMLHERLPQTASSVSAEVLTRVRAEISPLARNEGMDLIEARCEAFRETLARYARSDDALAEGLSETYFAILSKDIRPFPGVIDCLGKLVDDGYVLGILSNGISYLDHLGLADLFEHSVYAHDVLLYKPERTIFEHAMSLVGARPEQCLLIGDSCVCDVVGAREAGWTGVWLKRDGYRWDTDAEPPEHIVGDLTELPPLIASLNENPDAPGEQRRR